MTRNPLERAEILDEILSIGKWKGPELLEKLNSKLLNIDKKSIDSRTLKRDLEFLEEKGAPLHRPKKGNMFYYYEEKFSLTDLPLDSDEVNSLKQAISILKNVDNFQITKDLDLIIGKLENRIHTNVEDNQTIVQFENHTSAAGGNWFNDLFDSIKHKTVLKIRYHSFKQHDPKDYLIHPYLLKEYRNRWFLICRNDESARLLTLALDRIKKISPNNRKYIDNNLFNPKSYYEDVIGVSMDYNRLPEEVIIKIFATSAPHVESKPIHKNQVILKREADGSLLIKLKLMINYEFKSILMGFGDGIEVLKPSSLRDSLYDTMEKVCALYKS